MCNAFAAFLVILDLCNLSCQEGDPVPASGFIGRAGTTGPIKLPGPANFPDLQIFPPRWGKGGFPHRVPLSPCFRVSISLQSGNLKRASQPRSSRRFSSVSVPPCASAICRERTRPMPEPSTFVVKKGTKRFAVLARPGPSSVTHTSSLPLF